MLQCSTLPTIDAKPLPSEGNPFWLRKVTGLAAYATSRNGNTVNNIPAAFDGNDYTLADGAFWGSGQGILVTLPAPIRIGKARLVSHTYDGPEWGGCSMSFGSANLGVSIGNKGEANWTGDVTASSIDVIEYARTHIYAVEIWEKVFFNA